MCVKVPKTAPRIIKDFPRLNKAFTVGYFETEWIIWCLNSDIRIGRYFWTEYYSYLVDLFKPNIFVFAWLSKHEYHSYLYSVEVWEPNSIDFTQSQNFKCSVLYKGTEDPVCNFSYSKFWYLLLFNGFIFIYLFIFGIIQIIWVFVFLFVQKRHSE